jgi:hypothetical protein
MDDLEGFEGDAFDAIQKFSERQTVDEEFNASQDFQDKAPRGSPVKGDAIKRLEDERWHNHLDHNEREVVRRAKADDEFAKEELYKCFHKTVLDIAGDPKHGGPEFKDLVAAGAVGLWEAAKRFDPRRNNGFYAYARKFIEGEILDLVHDWHQKGGKLETRAERENRKAGIFERPVYIELNTIGERHDEDGHDADGDHNGNAITGWIEADDKELRECDGSGGIVTKAAWKRIEDGRKRLTNWCPNHPRLPCCPNPEPCKPIERERYEEDQARAHRFDTAAFIQRRLSQRLTNIGRNYGVPRECFGVDENPHRNGGGYPLGARFPIPSVPDSAPLVRYGHTNYGELLPGEVLALPLYRKARPPGWQGPELPLYLEVYPTPDRHKADAPKHGNAPALGTIGYLAAEYDAPRKARTQPTLRNLRRLAQIGRQKYAEELVAKDAAKPKTNPHVVEVGSTRRVRWANGRRYHLGELELHSDKVTANTYTVPYQTNTAATAVLPLTVSATKLDDSVEEQRNREKPLPTIHDSCPTHGRDHAPVFGPLWHRWSMDEHNNPSGNNPTLRLVALTQAAGIQRETQTHSSTRPWDDVHRIDRSDGRTNRQTSRGSS